VTTNAKERAASYDQSDCNVYPFGVGADADGLVPTFTSAANRRYSLHSQLLPYIEQRALFNNEPRGG